MKMITRGFTTALLFISLMALTAAAASAQEIPQQLQQEVYIVDSNTNAVVCQLVQAPNTQDEITLYSYGCPGSFDGKHAYENRYVAIMHNQLDSTTCEEIAHPAYQCKYCDDFYIQFGVILSRTTHAYKGPACSFR